MASSIPIFPMSPPLFDSERAQRRRMPHLPTSSIDTKTILSPTTDSVRSPHPDAATANDSAAASSPTSPSRQRIVLTDHVAFRYLEEDPSTIVLSRRQQLEGYEIYLVEQWACSREHPTFIITTYTGNPKDTVWTSILSVPADESQWSPQMRLYFKALEKYHARSKETPLGNLMITNLSGFPSSLTVIPVPEGDMKKYRELFFVTENLKRLGCSGRLGIQLAPPSGATQAKFHQLYRVSDKIPLNSSVIELVKLCQVALVLFGKLEPEYADGLLCDVTERAINDWWLEFGAEYYTAEPHDGILGPTTVAALLGMLMGARNRLSACNAPVAKDVFDIASTKRGIAYFQKTQRIAKTRRLDRQTLERLRKATTKAASKESWAVPRAFKSTVAELGGKGGEMVMGIVGAGEKAGIADIETVDIDRFVELVQGEHAKWLWHGKPRKTPTGDMFSRLPGEERSTSPDERNYPGKLLKRESTLEGHSLAKRDTIEEPAEGFEKEKEKEKSREKDKEKRKEKDRDKEREKDSKRAAIKRATGIIESGSGFHRIRGKVGLLSHQSKYKDDDDRNSIKADLQSPQSFTADGTPSSTTHERPPLGDNRMSDTYSLISPQRTIAEEEPTFSKVLTETPKDSMTTLTADQTQLYVPNAPATEEESTTNPPTVENSTAGSIYNNIDEKLPFDETNVIPPLLRRTQSADQLDSLHMSRNENWWPRRLSFSMVEEAIFKWTSIIPTCTDLDEEDNAQETPTLAAKMATYNLITEEAKRLQHQLSLLSTTDATWVSTHLSTLATLSTALDADISELDSIYFPRLDDYQTVNDDVHDLLLRTRTQLQESLREMANLGDKLDYEIGTLRSKVEDVEDGVVELERQVQEVESRVVELEGVTGEREGWVHWGFRVLTGIGGPPG